MEQVFCHKRYLSVEIPLSVVKFHMHVLQVSEIIYPCLVVLQLQQKPENGKTPSASQECFCAGRAEPRQAEGWVSPVL
jgi:hypothetical protein